MGPKLLHIEITSIKPLSTIILTMKLSNILNSIQSKYRSIKKAIPLTQKVLGSVGFWRQTRLLIALSLARTDSLAYRANLVKIFFAYILKLSQKNGVDFTVKYLKCCSVAIQKELGKDGILSLRNLEKDLPLPRLTNRLPRIIPLGDRAYIKAGNTAVIRFWLSLFNLYRILKATPKIKLESITAPFSGSLDRLEAYKAHAISGMIFFDTFSQIKKWRERNLSPQGFEISKAASPSHSISCRGLLHDIVYMYDHRKDLYETLHYLAFASLPVQTPFMEHLTVGYDIYTSFIERSQSEMIMKDGKTKLELPKGTVSRAKVSMVDGLSQFAVKEEAAGKVRVFALVDSLTQTFMRPLHDLCFDILRALPNDGTFDQEASIKRGQEKAIKANKAFSFDLTAATDRLPVSLSESILAGLLNNSHYAMYWKQALTDRDFWFNQKVAERYNVSAGPYRYAVGQPMGGLSSWAMLALTHHWIVQIAAFKATNRYRWNDEYEILGDDLVIFDEKIAKFYLEIMIELGCEINLNKSISSPTRPVFEFAKRTCWGPNVVSGVSFGQIRAGWNVGSRTANALHFGNAGLITNPNLLLAVLSKNSLNSFIGLKDRITSISILSLLSAYYQQGRITLESLITALFDPKKGIEFASETVGLPVQTALGVCYELVQNREIHEPWSCYEERREIFLEHNSFLTMQTLLSSVALGENLVNKWKAWVRIGSYNLLSLPVPIDYDWTKGAPLYDKFLDKYPDDIADLTFRLTEWWGDTLGLGIVTDDPAELLEEARDRLIQFQYEEMETLDEALGFAKRLENFQTIVTPAVKADTPETVIESASVIPLVRGLFGLQRLKEVKSLQY